VVSAPAAPGLASDDEKIIYALGLYIYQSLGTFDLSPAEVDLVKRGFADAAAGKGAVDLNTWGPRISKFAQERGGRAAQREKAAGDAFLAKAAAEPGAEKTASGLVYRELRAGTGASPAPTDKVKVNYKGTLTNGTEFDSSYSRNAPIEFALNGVIPCWTEGVQKMKVGGKASLTCPSAIAYGDRGRPPAIPGGATLVFEVELLDVAAPSAPAAPPAAPPAPAPPAAPAK
jgi:FKBP-type peptidyl-prolyl cis-trans isomerase FkpA